MSQSTENEDDDDLPLFRSEVMAGNSDRWLGPILLENKLSPVHILGAIAFFLSLAILLVMLSTYTRKATVPGWLVPNVGLIRIMAPFAGVVTALNVTEGQEIRKGDALLTISAEVTSENGTRLGESVLNLLKGQYSLQLKERRLVMELEQRLLESAKKKITNTKTQRDALRKELGIVESQVLLSRQSLEAKRKNFKNKISVQEIVVSAESDYLNIQATQARLLQNAALLDQELDIASEDLARIPSQTQSSVTAINRRLLEIQQQLAESNAKRAVTITAPESGVVSSIQSNVSSAAPLNVPLLTIIPENSKLVAHLYGTSKSIGLVSLGDEVYIRYEAFPYQRFGIFKGDVNAVSQSALGPAELPPQLATITRNNLNNESLYRIEVELDKYTVENNSKTIRLQAGLRLDADVSLESRPLYQWIFEPLFTSLKIKN